VLNILQKETKDLSGAILSKLCQKANKLALRECIIDKKKKFAQSAMEIDEPSAAIIEIRRTDFEEAIVFVRRLVFESVVLR